jgi:hypothetical protein
MAASARFLERDAATLTRPLHLSEHQRRDRLRDSSTKTLLQSGAAQIFSRSAWSVIIIASPRPASQVTRRASAASCGAKKISRPTGAEPYPDAGRRPRGFARWGRRIGSGQFRSP